MGFTEDVLKMAQEGVNKAEAKARNIYVDQASLSDQDIQGILDQLTSKVSTLTAQNQNSVNDTLFDAPLATKLAAKRGATIKGNEAIAEQVPKLALAQKQSENQAFKEITALQQQQRLANEQIKAQKDAQTQSIINNLFSELGMLIFSGGTSAATSTLGATDLPTLSNVV